MWPLVLMFVARTVALDSECLPFHRTVSQCLSHQPIQLTSSVIEQIKSRYPKTYRRDGGPSVSRDRFIHTGAEETFIQCVVNHRHQGYEEHYDKCLGEILQNMDQGTRVSPVYNNRRKDSSHYDGRQAERPHGTLSFESKEPEWRASRPHDGISLESREPAWRASHYDTRPDTTHVRASLESTESTKGTYGRKPDTTRSKTSLESTESTWGTSHYDTKPDITRSRVSFESKEPAWETSLYNTRPDTTRSRVSWESQEPAWGTSHYDTRPSTTRGRVSLESKESTWGTSHYGIGRDATRGRVSLESRESTWGTSHYGIGREATRGRVSLESRESPWGTSHYGIGRDATRGRVSLESKEFSKGTRHYPSHQISFESKESFRGIPYYDTYSGTRTRYSSNDRGSFESREGAPYYRRPNHSLDYSSEHRDTDENESAEGAAIVCHRQVAKTKDARQAQNAYLKCLQKYLQGREERRHDERRTRLEDSLRKVDEGRYRYPKWKASLEDSPEDTVSEEVENAAVQCHHQSFRKAKGNTKLATKMYADCLKKSLIQVDYAQPQYSIESHELDSVEFVDHFTRGNAWFDSSEEHQRFGFDDLDRYPNLDDPNHHHTSTQTGNRHVNTGTHPTEHVQYINPRNPHTLQYPQWTPQHPDAVVLQASNSTRNYSWIDSHSYEDDRSDLDWFRADSHEIDSIELNSHSMENDIEDLAMECHKRSISSKGTLSATQEYKKCIQKKLSTLFSRDDAVRGW